MCIYIYYITAHEYLHVYRFVVFHRESAGAEDPSESATETSELQQLLRDLRWGPMGMKQGSLNGTFFF